MAENPDARAALDQMLQTTISDVATVPQVDVLDAGAPLGQMLQPTISDVATAPQANVLDARAPLGQMLQTTISDVATATQVNVLDAPALLHDAGKLLISDASVSDHEHNQILMHHGPLQVHGHLLFFNQPAEVIVKTGAHVPTNFHHSAVHWYWSAV